MLFQRRLRFLEWIPRDEDGLLELRGDRKLGQLRQLGRISVKMVVFQRF